LGSAGLFGNAAGKYGIVITHSNDKPVTNKRNSIEARII
jgi:hypothetical protein